jgi:hypothetical protein
MEEKFEEALASFEELLDIVASDGPSDKRISAVALGGLMICDMADSWEERHGEDHHLTKRAMTLLARGQFLCNTHDMEGTMQ